MKFLSWKLTTWWCSHPENYKVKTHFSAGLTAAAAGLPGYAAAAPPTATSPAAGQGQSQEARTQWGQPGHLYHVELYYTFNTE